MSRRSKKRRRSKKGRHSSKSSRSSWIRWLRVELEEVEFAKGHDGFLRGKPEPVFIIAAFAVDEGGISLLGRDLRNVLVSEPYPSTTKISPKFKRELINVGVPKTYGRILILGMAVEMDGGGDVKDLYADLEKPEALSSWSVGDLMPEPLTLAEAGRGQPTTPPSATKVHLIGDSLYLHERCKIDDWVGATIVVLDVEKKQNERWRFHVVSRDERNDWTALVRIRL